MEQRQEENEIIDSIKAIRILLRWLRINLLNIRYAKSLPEQINKLSLVSFIITFFVFFLIYRLVL